MAALAVAAAVLVAAGCRSGRGLLMDLGFAALAAFVLLGAVGLRCPYCRAFVGRERSGVCPKCGRKTEE
jgi:predicted amidophosphoribosyltransferase